jgi:hypothetical protein
MKRPVYIYIYELYKRSLGVEYYKINQIKMKVNYENKKRNYVESCLQTSAFDGLETRMYRTYFG